MNALLQRALWPAVVSVCLVHGQPSTSSLEDRIARLEQQLARIEARLGPPGAAAELAPVRGELAEIGRQAGGRETAPPPAAGPARDRRFSVGGHMQVQAEFGGLPDARYAGVHNRVLIRRARLTVRGALAESVDFVFQPDFGNNAVAGNAAYRGAFTDAYLTWTRFPAASVQLGQFKTPFGYEQLLADTAALTLERSLVNDSLTVGRQIGFAVFGTVPGGPISYSVGSFNGNGANNGNNDNDQFLHAGRVAAALWSRGSDRLGVGANGYWTRDTGTFTGHRTGAGADVQLTLNRFSLLGEYLRLRSSRGAAGAVTAAGWSALAGYFVVPGTLQAVVRYETFDAHLGADGFVTPAWVLGANYLIRGDELKLMFNYTLGDPAGPAGREGRFTSRLQVVF